MMPAFAGSLQQYPLADVLRTIEERQMTGRLFLRYDGLDVFVYVARGHWLLAERPEGALPLAVLLVQAGYIAPNMFEVATGVPYTEVQTVTDSQAARMLVSGRILSQEQLRSWALQDAHDLLEHVWTLSDGEFYFEENITPPPNRYAIPLPIGVLLPPAPPRGPYMAAAGFMSPAPGITDMPGASSGALLPESAYPALPLHPDAPIILPEIPRQVEGTVRLTREQWRVLTMVDGQSSLREIAANLQVPENVILRVLTELLNAGLVLVGEYA